MTNDEIMRQCITHHYACECREHAAAETYDELQRLKIAARKLFTVKGRHLSQIAMCELGELLGYPVVWPTKSCEIGKRR